MWRWWRWGGHDGVVHGGAYASLSAGAPDGNGDLEIRVEIQTRVLQTRIGCDGAGAIVLDASV